MVFIHFQFIAVDKFVLYEVSNQTRIQSPSVPHKICLCVGIEREEGRYIHQGSETRQGFYLDSAHQHTEHTPQLLTHKNCGRCIFSRLCHVVFVHHGSRCVVLFFSSSN